MGRTRAEPPLQIAIAMRGFIERVCPHALDLMIRRALDEPVQNQLVGHTSNQVAQPTLSNFADRHARLASLVSKGDQHDLCR